MRKMHENGDFVLFSPVELPKILRQNHGSLYDSTNQVEKVRTSYTCSWPLLPHPLPLCLPTGVDSAETESYFENAARSIISSGTCKLVRGRHVNVGYATKSFHQVASCRKRLKMGCIWASLAASPLGQNSRMVIQNLQTTNPKAPGWGFHCIPKKWKPGHVSNHLPAWCIHCSHLQPALGSLGRNHQEAEFRRCKGSTWGQIGTMTIQHQSWGRFMNFNGVFLVKGNQGSLKVFGSLTGHGEPFPAVQGWIEELDVSSV